MKKTALLSSILTIALCLCLIAGSTFALFTSETDVDVVVDAGRVNIKAGLTTPKLYSAKADAAGTEFDENGKSYSYDPQTGSTFANGGTAVLGTTLIEGTTDKYKDVISLENVTPGDKIEFSLTGNNTSDVAVMYRYKIECLEGYDLMSGFVVTVEGTKYASMASYVSEWRSLPNIGAEIPEVKLALELPISAGNEYQMLDAKIKVSVEAVQANADLTDPKTGKNPEAVVKYITTVDDAATLKEKLNSEEILHIFVREDIEETVTISNSLTNKTIDADGNSVHLSFVKGTDKDGAAVPITLTNVVVKNLKTKTINIATGVNGDLTILDSTFTSDTKLGSAGANAFIAGRGDKADNLNITVEGCTFDGHGVVDYGVYFMNVHNLTVRNCEIKNTKSWGVQCNGTVTGNVVVSGVDFVNTVGILKAGVKGGSTSPTDGTLSGNFTFANNTMVGCKTKNDVYVDVDYVGLLTFSNNTMNDVVVTPEDMLDIKLIVLP